MRDRGEIHPVHSRQIRRFPTLARSIRARPHLFSQSQRKGFTGDTMDCGGSGLIGPILKDGSVANHGATAKPQTL
jgi:hypothetical protein